MRLLRWTFAVYLVAVLVVTCWPSPQSTAAPGWALAVLEVFRSVGLPISYEFLEAASNVVMFVPFGVLGLLVLSGARPEVPLRHGLGTVVLAGFVLSLAIELSQLVIPGRYPTVQDVVMNTTGAVVGAVVVAGILGARRPLTRS